MLRMISLLLRRITLLLRGVALRLRWIPLLLRRIHRLLRWVALLLGLRRLLERPACYVASALPQDRSRRRSSRGLAADRSCAAKGVWLRLELRSSWGVHADKGADSPPPLCRSSSSTAPCGRHRLVKEWLRLRLTLELPCVQRSQHDGDGCWRERSLGSRLCDCARPALLLAEPVEVGCLGTNESDDAVVRVVQLDELRVGGGSARATLHPKKSVRRTRNISMGMPMATSSGRSSWRTLWMAVRYATQASDGKAVRRKNAESSGTCDAERSGGARTK